MPNKNPIRWKLVVWMNLAMLGGCVLAAFVVAPTTRLSVFGFICLACVIAFNLRLLKSYRRKLPDPSIDSKAKQPKDVRFWRAVLIIAGWTFLIWQIAHRYWLK